MAQDPQVKPLVEELYGAAISALAEVEEKLGVPLPRLLEAFAGEICLGLVAPEEGEISGMVLLDVGPHIGTAETVIDRISNAIESQGATRQEEEVGDTKFVVYDFPDDRPSIVHFERDETVVFSSSVEVVKHVLQAWNGEKVPSLAQNPRYVLVKNNSRGPNGQEPDILLYADPIGVASAALRDRPAAQLVLTMLPFLGVDGIRAVGGSITMALGEYDFYERMHLFLENPRTGILAAIALKDGDTTPERWVPKDANAYMTGHWDAKKTYTELAKMIDSLPGRGEGSTARQVQDVFNQLEVNFEKDILPAIEGRVTMTTWFGQPVSIASNFTLVGIRLTDARSFAPLVEKPVQLYPDGIMTKNYGGTTYYEIKVPEPPADAIPNSMPHPCFAILGDYLLIGNQPAILHQAILSASDPAESLAESLEYKVIASKISRVTGGEGISGITWSSPEQGIRFWYEMAIGNRDALREGQFAKRLPFLKQVDDALNEHPLPPFEVLQQYLAPTGGVLTIDETGVHYIEFGLRRRNN